MKSAIFTLVGMLLASGMPVMAHQDENALRDMMRAMVGPWEEQRQINSAADAEAYAERLCTGIYSAQHETERQLPFHAADEGATWRVTGSRPYGWPNEIGGPLTVVIEKATGRVRKIFFTGAPAGWDADILRKLGRNPDGTPGR